MCVYFVPLYTSLSRYVPSFLLRCCLSQQALQRVGGPKKLAEMLQSDATHGLHADDDLEERASQFGRNWMPVPDPKTWVQLFIDSFDDTTLIILIVSAVVSLAVSIG